MDHFQQKTLFGKREIKIYDSKFSYTIYNFGQVNEFMIPFEKLTNHKLSQKKAETAYLLVSIVTYALAFLFAFTQDESQSPDDLPLIIIMALAATVSLAIYFLQRQDLWKIILTDGTILTIYKKVPSRESSDAFYNELIAARNKYVKHAYFTAINPDCTLKDKLQNVKWLKSIEAITETEYEEKSNELNGSVSRKIGF